MATKQAGSTKPRALVQKRAATSATQRKGVPAMTVAAGGASKKAASKVRRKVEVADLSGIGVPTPLTGQAAFDLAVRAGIINKNGDLKPRFR